MAHSLYPTEVTVPLFNTEIQHSQPRVMRLVVVWLVDLISPPLCQRKDCAELCDVLLAV